MRKPYQLTIPKRYAGNFLHAKCLSSELKASSRLLRSTPKYQLLQSLMPFRQNLRESRFWDAYKSFAAYPDYYYWRLRGSPMRRVPHLVKQRTLQEHARRYNLRTMVETGTNLGQMIAAMLPLVDNIWSIEMGDWSYNRARQRFAANPNIHLVHGDSGVKMYEVAPQITQPCLYWLDAHEFDRLTPIREELDAIASHFIPGSIILIDDSKWFDGRNQYPTMDWVRDFTRSRLPGYSVHDSMHIIRLLPDQTA